MIIAKFDDFELRVKNYLGEHEYLTNDIEICKRNNTNNSIYTIASFNDKGEVVSCGDRLFRCIETEEELYWIRKLIEIGEKIVLSDITPSGYGKMREVKTWRNGRSILEEPDTIRKYPTEKDLVIYEAVAEIDCKSKYYWNEEDAIDYLMNSYEKCVNRGYVEDMDRDEVRETLKTNGELVNVGAYWIVEVK